MKQEWEKAVLVSEGWPAGYVLGRGGRRPIWRQDPPVPELIREARRHDRGRSELVDLTGDESDGIEGGAGGKDGDGVGDDDDVDDEGGDEDHIADDDSVHQMEDESDGNDID